MRAANSSGKVNRMTGANEPEGCVLACNRGPVGSHCGELGRSELEENEKSGLKEADAT